jgi:hypothetical protein
LTPNIVFVPLLFARMPKSSNPLEFIEATKLGYPMFSHLLSYGFAHIRFELLQWGWNLLKSIVNELQLIKQF